MDNNVVSELICDTVIKLTLNRPDKKNAITQSMYRSLTETMSEADSNPTIRGIWLTGTGGDFTSGNDLDDFARCKRAEDLSDVLSFLNYLPKFSKLLIITVQGVAVGIGTTLLNFADFVYSTKDARFQLPFTALGLCPEAGSTYFLPSTLGRPQSGPLLYLGEPFDGIAAEKAGLVTELFENSNAVDGATIKLITQLSTLPSTALLRSKQCVLQDTERLHQWMNFESRTFLSLLLEQAKLKTNMPE